VVCSGVGGKVEGKEVKEIRNAWHDVPCVPRFVLNTFKPVTNTHCLQSQLCASCDLCRVVVLWLLQRLVQFSVRSKVSY
jgi:hypothetical protein